MGVLWRSFKKHSSDAEMTETKHRKGKKSNLYASSGLEKFVPFLDGLQAMKSPSLVCAAEILVRKAIRRSGTRQVHSVAKSAEVVKPTQGGCEKRSGQKLHRGISDDAEILEAAEDGKFHRDEGKKGEEQPFEGRQISNEKVCSVALRGARLPVRTGRNRPVRKNRSLHCPERNQTSKTAFVVLVALGDFVSNRFGKLETQIAAFMGFNDIAGVWRMGKYYTKFMLSSVAIYFLRPLRSRLSRQASRRLVLTAICEKGFPIRTEEAAENLETAVYREQSYSSVEITATPSKQSDPVRILLPNPDGEAIVLTTKDRDTPGSSRWLLKNILSRFKKLKLLSTLRSSAALLILSERSKSDTSKPMSPFSQHSTMASSPDGRYRGLFSRLHYKLHKVDSAFSDRMNGKKTATSLASNSLISPQDQRNPSGNMCGKKSTTSRLAELHDQCNDGETSSFTSSFDIITSTASASPAPSVPPADSRGASVNELSWPLLGLFDFAVSARESYRCHHDNLRLSCRGFGNTPRPSSLWTTRS